MLYRSIEHPRRPNTTPIEDGRRIPSPTFSNSFRSSEARLRREKKALEEKACHRSLARRESEHGDKTRTKKSRASRGDNERKKQREENSQPHLVLDLRDLLHGRHGGSDGLKRSGRKRSLRWEEEGRKETRRKGKRLNKRTLSFLSLRLSAVFSVLRCCLSFGRCSLKNKGGEQRRRERKPERARRDLSRKRRKVRSVTTESRGLTLLLRRTTTAEERKRARRASEACLSLGSRGRSSLRARSFLLPLSVPEARKRRDRDRDKSDDRRQRIKKRPSANPPLLFERLFEQLHTSSRCLSWPRGSTAPSPGQEGTRRRRRR